MKHKIETLINNIDSKEYLMSLLEQNRDTTALIEEKTGESLPFHKYIAIGAMATTILTIYSIDTESRLLFYVSILLIVGIFFTIYYYKYIIHNAIQHRISELDQLERDKNSMFLFIKNNQREAQKFKLERINVLEQELKQLKEV